MKILILTDELSKRFSSVSEAVVYAALEKHIDCEPLDLSDLIIDPIRTSSPEYIKKISDHIKEEMAEAVLCTSSYSMKLMSAVRAQEDNYVYCCCLVSECFGSPLLPCNDLDCYFAAHEDIKNALIKRGIPEGRIFVTGVPVKKSFRERIGKMAARNYLVIPRSKRVYLLMSEGLSGNYIIRLCEELKNSEQHDYLVYIPTVRYSEIKDQLMKYSMKDPHVRVITYTQKLNLYIESADVMLLKPDAVTSTEAAVSGVPMVHLFQGRDIQEENGDFFAKHEMAVIANSIRDAADKAKRFIEEKAMAARVIQMQYRNICSDAADRILDIINKEYRKWKVESSRS